MPKAHSLYLVRHAEAADHGAAYPDDGLRPLTREGAERFTVAVGALRALDVEIDRILSSPLLRTQQTAKILAEGLKGRPPVVLADVLAPGHAPADVLKALDAYADDRGLALVGHEPGIGALAGYLIGSRIGIPFKKGAVCRVDVDVLPPDGPGDLRWFLPPKLMRMIVT